MRNVRSQDRVYDFSLSLWIDPARRSIGSDEVAEAEEVARRRTVGRIMLMLVLVCGGQRKEANKPICIT